MPAIPTFVYYIGILVILSLIYIIFMVTRTKGKAKDFTTAHPDAAKVFGVAGAAASMKAGVAAGDLINIRAIDGVVADVTSAAGVSLGDTAGLVAARGQQVFARSMDGSYLIAPGEHTLSLVASHSRPGVMYRTVATTYGPTDVRVMLEPNKSYQLTFDRESQQFGIQER